MLFQNVIMRQWSLLFWLFSTWALCTAYKAQRQVQERNRYTCSEPEPILHGTYRKQRRSLRIFCDDGYSLQGARTVPCLNGKWDGAKPVCAKGGCSLTLPNPANGRVQVESKMKLSLYCMDNYIVAGNRFTYCNGTHWDRPLGTCRKISNKVDHECDFETVDICGWVADQTEFFEWKRVTAMNAFTSFRTGPQHDHTIRSHSGGHYMLMESRGRFLTPVSLTSPIYDRGLSLKTACCFRFYYFMYGSGVGDLFVFVKPESLSLTQVLNNSDKYLKFNKTGNQNNLWNEAHFSIDEMNEDFQIVFVANDAKSHLSDIAIDDVKLMTGSECRALEKTNEDNDDSVESNEVETTTEESLFDTQSCMMRCGSSGSGIMRKDGKLFGLCGCNFECILENDCCPDFIIICLDELYGSSDNASTTMEVPITTTTTTKKPTTTTTTTTTTKKPTTTTTTTTTTTKKPTTTTTKKPITTTTTTKTTTTKKPTTITTTTTTTTTTKKPTTTTTTTTTKKPTTTTTTTTTTKKPTTTTARKPIITTTTATTTTTTTTTRKPTTTTRTTTKRSETSSIDGTTIAVPDKNAANKKTPAKDNESNALNKTLTWKNIARTDNSSHSGTSGSSILLIILGVICVTIAVSATYLHRRRLVAAWMERNFQTGNDVGAAEDSTSIIANFNTNTATENGASAAGQMKFSKSNSKKSRQKRQNNDSQSSSTEDFYDDNDEIPLV